MQSKLAPRVALSTLLALAAVLPLQAKTPPPAAPTITFQLADQVTVHQHDGVVPVAVTCSDPAGLVTATVSGGYSSAACHYVEAPKSASMKLWFYVSYFPVGDYTFDATATNVLGIKSDHKITLHLVP